MSTPKNQQNLLLFNDKSLKVEDFLENPLTNNRYFGYVDGIHDYPTGYIILKWGTHRHNHKGFGCVHIWKQHQACFRVKRLCTKIEEIPSLVNRILQPGTQIIESESYDPNNGKRLAVLRSSTGTIILEWRKGYYSIVTLHLGKTMAGVVVGSVKRLPNPI